MRALLFIIRLEIFNLIRTITLGSQTFPVNLIQGPLAGVSCAPFRRLTWEYSQPAFSCTEMISCKTLLHQSGSKQRFIKKDPKEGPVCFQLSGHDVGELAEAVKRVTDYGADLIDLNCGCPVKKIRSRGCGSRLLSKPSQLYQLIKAMKDHTHVPVSIKIRIDGSSTDRNNQDIANAVQDAGADFLVVHGRHWTEHYETSCNYEQIQFFVETLSIPVIGNGDVACVETLKKMFATGCAGVMIGRAGVGQPWLIGQLVAQIQDRPFTEPLQSDIGRLFVTHIQELANLLESEKFAVIQARKFAKYYARKLPARLEFCHSIQQCEKLSQLESICMQFFSSHLLE